MAYSSLSDLSVCYKEKDHVCETVYEITSLVKEENYSLALELLKKNDISFYSLVNRTQRLKDKQLVKFADFVISHKGL